MKCKIACRWYKTNGFNLLFLIIIFSLIFQSLLDLVAEGAVEEDLHFILSYHVNQTRDRKSVYPITIISYHYPTSNPIMSLSYHAHQTGLYT